MSDNPVEPQELLSRILAAKHAVLEQGGRPTRVYLSKAQYRTIQLWHASLGDLNDPSVDYVGDYEILQLEVFDDPSGSLRVE
ncbi:MAG: hypothetical protein ACOCZ9_01630 [Spirochaetota bacterium]